MENGTKQHHETIRYSKSKVKITEVKHKSNSTNKKSVNKAIGWTSWDILFVRERKSADIDRGLRK